MIKIEIKRGLNTEIEGGRPRSYSFSVPKKDSQLESPPKQKSPRKTLLQSNFEENIKQGVDIRNSPPKDLQSKSIKTISEVPPPLPKLAPFTKEKNKMPLLSNLEIKKRGATEKFLNSSPKQEEINVIKTDSGLRLMKISKDEAIKRVKKNGLIFEALPFSLRIEFNVALAAVTQNELTMYFVPIDLLNDPKFQEAIQKQNPQALVYLQACLAPREKFPDKDYNFFKKTDEKIFDDSAINFKKAVQSDINEGQDKKCVF